MKTGVLSETIITAVLLIAQLGAIAYAEPEVAIDFDRHIFSLDNYDPEGCDVYAALYCNEKPVKIIKNRSFSGWSEDINNARVFFWNGMTPVYESKSYYKPDGYYVDSTETPERGASHLTLEGGRVVSASGKSGALPDGVSLADAKANTAAKDLYRYLSAVGESDMLLIGQQNYIDNKAGSRELSDSDVFDITGDHPAVFGIDTLSISGAEYSAYKCNMKYGTSFPQNTEGEIAATAYYTNKAIENGSIVTLSSHMPNFATVRTADENAAVSYERYDFNVYSSPELDGNTANEILPGGKYNDIYKAYLDLIAAYVKRINGAVLFRPFHENTGSWFWWGAELCEPETYKRIYRYAKRYLTEVRGAHNLIFVYSPGSEPQSAAELELRYPGDDCVDIVGLDMYDNDPDPGSGWMAELKRHLGITNEFAKTHGKLCALTETGAANETLPPDSQTAFLRYGNKNKVWYENVLDAASDIGAAYMLLWSSWGEYSAFYTPYVKYKNGDGSLHGHELLDSFISFYNDPRSVFASDQADVLSLIK